MVIDEIDREIIRLLQTMGRMTHREIGQEVALSANAAGARVQRLIDRGIITGFGAKVDHAKLGQPMEASIDVWLTEAHNRSVFADFVANDDRLVECFHLTGPLDFRVRARVASAEDLNDLLSAMRDDAGARTTDSRLVLEQLPTT